MWATSAIDESEHDISEHLGICVGLHRAVHPAPKSTSEEVTFPQEFWTVVILSVILFVLLAWKAIDEMIDNPGDDDNSINRHPPY
jgi:hypothetical protein